MKTANYPYEIGERVRHPADRVPFIVTGVRYNEVRILGDWSGGTHNVQQEDWVHINEVSPTSQFNKPPVNGQWIKAIDRLPQHMLFQFIKVAGIKYCAYYDYSIRKFLQRVGDRGFEIQDVEWLDESPSPGSVDVEDKKEYCDGTFYCSLDSTYNSDGTCGGCGKKKRNGVYGLGDSSGSEKEELILEKLVEFQIIEFGTWYSGMEQSKVERAYQRWLKERKV